MGEQKSICVYCGSSNGTVPEFVKGARKLGQMIGNAGYNLVYGGGDIGLMGEVSRSALECGAHVVGIIPEFLVEREHLNKKLALLGESIITKDMHERKHLMFERSDAFVALPGGIGTLEELVEMMTWAQLGRHQKPIVLANISNFWSPLISLLNHMQESGFLHSAELFKPMIISDVEAIVPALGKLLNRPPVMW